jgi:hypothetical protein
MVRGAVRDLKAFAQLVISGLRRVGSVVGSCAISSGLGVWRELVEDEDAEDAGRRVLRISVERESSAGCRYPSNQRLKHES